MEINKIRKLDELQSAKKHQLKMISCKYGVNIFISKAEEMGMCGRSIQRIIAKYIYGNLTEQVPDLICLGNMIQESKKNTNIKPKNTIKLLVQLK
jgi:hypothetical protein